MVSKEMRRLTRRSHWAIWSAFRRRLHGSGLLAACSGFKCNFGCSWGGLAGQLSEEKSMLGAGRARVVSALSILGDQ